METHSLGPKTILNKHIELEPKLTLVVSLSEKNEITLDMSHPMELKELSVLYFFMKRHVEKFMDRQMSPPKTPESIL